MKFEEQEKENTTEKALEVTEKAIKCIIDPEDDNARQNLKIDVEAVATAIEKKAETLKKELTESFESTDKVVEAKDYATKEDLKQMESNMDLKFTKMESNMDLQFKKMESNMDLKFTKMESDMDLQFKKMESNMDLKFTEMMAVATNSRIRDLNKRMIKTSSYDGSTRLEWPVLETGDDAGRVPSILNNTCVTKSEYQRQVPLEKIKLIRSAYGTQFRERQGIEAQMALQIFLG